MGELTGWLLDLYPTGNGISVWLILDDGQRLRLEQAFPITFYAAGSTTRLHALRQWLSAQPEPLSSSRAERQDLFSGSKPVLAVEVQHAADLPAVFRRASQVFPDLSYFDVDIQLSMRYAAAFGVFPLARCRVKTDNKDLVSISPLDSPWDLDPYLPPLRILSLEPDQDPFHVQPEKLIFTYEGRRYSLPFEPARSLLVSLRSLLNEYDPDLLLTAWGDTWLLPRLLEFSQAAGIGLPFNRDPSAIITQKPQRSYFAYGQVIYRGQQVYLAGRWHIDVYNTVMYHDYGLNGVLELARITGLPVQTVARTSPGTGISAMQIGTALWRGVLVPWHKQQAESPKSALDLIRSDMGGLVYQPTVGLHANVAEVDFVSMYPGIMADFNISPETILPGQSDPKTSLPATKSESGLVPETLRPLLKKRLAVKAQLMSMPKWDPRRRRYEAWASAYKWLLVTCFGYLGYKNARFGRIEAHEAVTAYGREALLRAKEISEELGFDVLHLYVDGMWVKKNGYVASSDFLSLLSEIFQRARLPISLDGVFRWVVFLPSRVDERNPVPNRYFGVFQSGEIKARGIELRRRDTPQFVREVQQELLNTLARAPTIDNLSSLRSNVQAVIRRRLAQLRSGCVPPEKLIVRQTLSRELDRYHSPSPAALAAQQLTQTGRNLRPGQSVRFLYTLGKTKVRAWDLPGSFHRQVLDLPYYETLFMRAVDTICKPLGLSNANPRQDQLME